MKGVVIDGKRVSFDVYYVGILMLIYDLFYGVVSVVAGNYLVSLIPFGIAVLIVYFYRSGIFYPGKQYMGLFDFLRVSIVGGVLGLVLGYYVLHDDFMYVYGYVQNFI